MNHTINAELVAALQEMVAMREIQLAATRPQEKPEPFSAADNAYKRAIAALAKV